MFFANEQREKVREDNPGITFGKSPLYLTGAAVANILLGQVGKMLGEKWKNLSDTERRPYEEKAAADKKRYEQEKEAYNVSSRYRDLLTARTNGGKQQQQQNAEEEEESS